MIKALVGIGDIHLRKKDFFEVGIEKFEKWFDETFPNEAKENTEIILAGDIFDKKRVFLSDMWKWDKSNYAFL